MERSAESPTLGSPVPSSPPPSEQPAASQEVVQIDPRGDIILVVGPDQGRLLVNSMVLKLMSKVFVTLLSPTFKEGKAFADHTGPGHFELKLPEDDCKAMTTLLRIAHFTPEAAQPSRNELVEIAIIADKYDCTKVVSILAGLWMKDNPNLVASFLLNDPKAFKAATNHGVFFTCGPAKDQASMDKYGRLPDEVFAMLEEQRLGVWNTNSTVIFDYCAGLIKSKIPHIPTAQTSAAGNRMFVNLESDTKLNLAAVFAYTALQRCLLDEHIMPLAPAKDSLFELKFKLNNLTEFKLRLALGGGVADLGNLIKDFRVHVERWKAVIDRGCKGLCLDCVKGGRKECNEDCRK